MSPSDSNDAILAELGARLDRHRLERNITQDALAAEAGIGRATLQRMLAGESVQITTLISVLRALDLLDGLDLLVPEPLPSPIERLRTEGRRRKRARRPESPGQPQAPRDLRQQRSDKRRPDNPWTWGDEPDGPAAA